MPNLLVTRSWALLVDDELSIFDNSLVLKRFRGIAFDFFSQNMGAFKLRRPHRAHNFRNVYNVK